MTEIKKYRPLLTLSLKTVEQATGLIYSFGDTMHESIYGVGTCLIFIKKEVGHSNFGPWLKEHIHLFAYRTARRYMKFAKACDREGRILPYESLKLANLAILPPPALPEGQFCLLYADPPWQYEFSETDSRKIENQYGTMTCQQICEQQVHGRLVSDVAAEDAVLFLWATAPKQTEAATVLEAWGFTLRTSMVWVKDRIGMGYWVRGRHEYLLIGQKGNFPPPEPGNRFDSVLEAPRREHSEKPIDMYERLEHMYPLFTERHRIELYARKARPGWASWGNELEKIAG